MKELEKIIARTLCFKHQRFSDQITVLITVLIFFRFSRTNFPFEIFNVNPSYHLEALHFAVLSYEKQHKEGIYKDVGRSVIFSAF